MNKNILIALGKKAFEEKNYRSAEKILLNAVEKGAMYPDVLYTLGLACHFLGEINRAIHFLKEALKINPNYVEAQLSLSITLNDIGKYREARDIFQGAVNTLSEEKKSIPDDIVKPRMVNLHRELGSLCISINRYEQAVFHFKKALEIAPDYTDVKLEFATALREKGEFGEAKGILEEILEERPGFVPALQSMGIICYAEGNVDDARAFWERALAIDPQNKLTLLYLNSIRKK